MAANYTPIAGESLQIRCKSHSTFELRAAHTRITKSQMMQAIFSAFLAQSRPYSSMLAAKAKAKATAKASSSSSGRPAGMGKVEASYLVLSLIHI